LKWQADSEDAFAGTLFGEVDGAGAEKVVEREDSNEAVIAVAFDYREAGDTGFGHAVNDDAERLVRVAERGIFNG
jgi:hypothetical protein